MNMQTAINPALAAAMTLERAAQVGEFNPLTPSGQPTVAAQLMQRAAPPSVPQIAQQAGLAGQIQAMQQAQAQQAMMRQAMAQQPPAGIESLNPNIQGFAPGGIVGYYGGGETEDSVVEPETAGGSLVEPSGGGAAMVVDPSTLEGYGVAEPARMPVTPPSPTTMEEQMRLGLEALKRGAPQEVTPEQTLKRLQANIELRNQALRAQGVDPEALDKLAEQSRLRGEQQAKYYEDMASQVKAGQRSDALINFLLGARGMRGQGLGELMRTGAGASIQSEKASEARAQRATEMMFDIQSAGAKEQRLYLQAKHQTAMGELGAAQKTLMDAERARQLREQKEADYRRMFGQELGRMERAEEREESRRYAADKRLEGIRERLQKSPGAAKGARVHKTITGPDGGVIAVMSDGTQVPLGVTSADFNRSIARIISDMEKNVTGFSRKTEQEKRDMALQRLTGGATPVPPPSAAPPAAQSGVARPTTQAQFDALPKGARYINPSDGKEYTKN